MEEASQKLSEYKRRCVALEKENATLVSQLESLKAMVKVNDVKQEAKVKVEPMESNEKSKNT